MSGPIWQWSAVRVAEAVRARDITVEQAVTAVLERMADANSAVNAVTVELADDALAAAHAADQAVAEGDASGCLHGVPVTIKENVDQAGLPTPNGVAAAAETQAPDNAPVVQNLLNAGAIVIGRTNTPEFSLRWFTDNPLRGATLNPWDSGITPGGSSGGAAVSVALGIGAIAHGNDLGGSLRYPAYCCGVASIRPSLGRVAAFNPLYDDVRALSYQLMSVQGPIAREVADLRLALEAMAARDVRDPWWTPAPLEWPVEQGPVKVAVTSSPEGLACDPRVAAAIDAAAGWLSDAGYDVHLTDPPETRELAACWREFLFGDVEGAGNPLMRQYGSEAINAIWQDYIASVGDLSLEAYVKNMGRRWKLVRLWQLFMEEYPIVLAPVSQVPPFPIDEDRKGTKRVREMLDQQSLLYGVNLLGLPSAAVPASVEENLPLGVQIIGRKFREDQCLDAAQAIEDAAGIFCGRLWTNPGVT